MTILEDILTVVPVEELDEFIETLPEESRKAIRREVSGARGLWRFADDPEAFVTDGLSETIWGKQRAILRSVRDWPRTVVPACHSPGKTHIGARVVAHFASTTPAGSGLVVTTATNFRTVRNQLWPHVRRLKERHGLPGRLNLTEWWIGPELVALGFSAKESDPEAVHGYHSARTLVVVDEGGGISDEIGGALDSLMTDENARMLVLGNPPTDEDGTWFQKICENPLKLDEAGNYLGGWNVIRIPAEATPNFTGEDAGVCSVCPPSIAPHPVATHLLSTTWVRNAIAVHGENSAYVVAKVFARFPEIVANRTIPIGWIERAADVEPPERGERINLGVDVAADGGDELAIARQVGFEVRLVHHSSGAHLHNEVDVSGIVWREIEECLVIRDDIGAEPPVRVKVDVIGLGWGVCSQLEKWVEEKGLGGKEPTVVIVRVNVGERAHDVEKFPNQRSEMWWSFRERLRLEELRLVTPPPPDLAYAVEDERLDQRLVAQLSGPTYKTNTKSQTVVESKESVKKRNPGAGSPDRAEAMLLADYDPPPVKPKKKKARLIA